MIIFELTRTEADPIYKTLEQSNGLRQYDFLRSIIEAAIAINRVFLSSHIIKALNFHAIACLHTNAGEFRPCQVTVGNHMPPAHYQVQALMDDLVNEVNRYWDQYDPITLSAYVLWKLNYIHPFINGNGRTARATAYFVLCVKSGGWLPGNTILPELLKLNRDEYVLALVEADKVMSDGDFSHLNALNALITRLIEEQLNTPEADPE